MRRCGLIIALAVLSVVVALAAARISADALILRGAERAGSEATGTPVEVETASLDVFGGRLVLGGTQVANPPGFESSDALVVPSLRIDAAISGLLSEPMRLDALVFERPVLTLEIGREGTNLGRLAERLEGRTEGDRRIAAVDPQQDEVVVDEVLLIEPRLVIAPLPGVGTEARVVTLDTIQLRDVGTGEEARRRTVAQLLRQVIAAVLADAAGKIDLPAAARAILTRELEHLRGALADVEARIEQVERGARLEVDRALETLRGGTQRAEQRARQTLEEGAGRAEDAVEREVEGVRQRTRQELEQAKERARELLERD